MPKAMVYKHPNKYVWSKLCTYLPDICELLGASIQDTFQDSEKPMYSKENPIWGNIPNVIQTWGTAAAAHDISAESQRQH